MKNMFVEYLLNDTDEFPSFKPKTLEQLNKFVDRKSSLRYICFKYALDRKELLSDYIVKCANDFINWPNTRMHYMKLLADNNITSGRVFNNYFTFTSTYDENAIPINDGYGNIAYLMPHTKIDIYRDKAFICNMIEKTSRDTVIYICDKYLMPNIQACNIKDYIYYIVKYCDVPRHHKNYKIYEYLMTTYPDKRIKLQYIYIELFSYAKYFNTRYSKDEFTNTLSTIIALLTNYTNPQS